MPTPPRTPEERSALIAVSTHLEAMLTSESTIRDVDLAHAAALVDAARVLVDATARAARAGGMAWPEVGECLGISAQGAQQRFARRPPPEQGEIVRGRYVAPGRTQPAVEDTRTLTDRVMGR